MDGASKFVRGDAIAGIIITLINIVGGLIIGMVEFGMTLAEAAKVFTQLTIGDGLVSQVPAFLISLAAGLLVTRSTQKANLPREFMQQLFSRPQALAVTGGFLGMLIFTSLPRLPLLTLAGGCFGLARMMTQKESAAVETAALEAEHAKKKPAEERIEDYLTVDPMEIEIGVGLIRLADPNRGGDLLDRVQTRAAEHRGRDRHPDAEGAHSRQHAARCEPVSHQDRRHSGGAGRTAADAAAGDRLRHDDREDRRHRDEGPGVRHRRAVDQPGAGGPGGDVWLHGRRKPVPCWRRT